MLGYEKSGGHPQPCPQKGRRIRVRVRIGDRDRGAGYRAEGVPPHARVREIGGPPSALSPEGAKSLGRIRIRIRIRIGGRIRARVRVRARARARARGAGDGADGVPLHARVREVGGPPSAPSPDGGKEWGRIRIRGLAWGDLNSAAGPFALAQHLHHNLYTSMDALSWCKPHDC